MFALQLRAGEVVSESCSISFCLVWSRIQPCAQAPGQRKEAGPGGSVGELQHIPDSELEVMPWCRPSVSAGTAMISFSVMYPAHQALLMPSLQLSLGLLIPPLNPS